jgi:peroxiredoxin
MRTAIVLVFIFLATLAAQSQGYEEHLDACGKKFRDGMEQAKRNDLMMKLMQDLRQCVIGQTVPDFSATSTDGKIYTREDLRGKVVLINMWFIACPPCVAEIPMLEDLDKQFKKKDFLLLTFSTDDKNSINGFMKKRTANYIIFPDSKPLIVNAFKMEFGFPVNMILDKEGKIVEFKMGGPVEEAGVLSVKREFGNIIANELAR